MAVPPSAFSPLPQESPLGSEEQTSHHVHAMSAFPGSARPFSANSRHGAASTQGATRVLRP